MSRRLVPLLLISAALATAGDCDTQSNKPQETTQASSNHTFTVDLLFIHDGVKVFRFYDDGRYHYYAVPNTGAPAEVTTSWTESCGKHCKSDRIEEMPTVVAVQRKSEAR